MKNLKYILIAGMAFLCACTVVGSYVPDRDAVKPGYVAFEGAYMAFNKDMGNISFVLAANDYILGDETTREEMRNGVFEDIAISQSGNQWTFSYYYGGDGEAVRYVIHTNGRDINETGVSWTVSKSNAAVEKKTDSEGRFTLSCTGQDTWKMNISSFKYYNWNKSGDAGGYVSTDESSSVVNRLSLEKNGGYQTIVYKVNNSAVYKSGKETDFRITSLMNGAVIRVKSEAGLYPFARKIPKSAIFTMMVENRNFRTDDVVAIVNSENVSVTFNKRRESYQVPDFTGLPKPSMQEDL